MVTLGCDAGIGDVRVVASGGTEAREGIAAAQMADGFSVRFAHAVLAVEGFFLRTRLGDEVEVAATPTLVELIPNAAELWRFEGISAGRWDDVGFESVPPPADVRADGIPARIRDQMVERGWSSYYEGVITDPAGDEYPFAIGLPVRARYLSCRNGADRALGVAVPEGGTAEVELTWHLTHLFFDSFAENSALRAEAFAATYDGERPIDLDALATQPLANLRGLDGRPLRNREGFPVLYIPPAEGAETLAEFVMSARLGHFNGLEGECTTEIERL
ncbi:MAG: hypothetical protein KF901_28060 [Myxococcales bacterium]|nr:hypothetical protein [Myxococcales bacterium]